MSKKANEIIPPHFDLQSTSLTNLEGKEEEEDDDDSVILCMVQIGANKHRPLVLNDIWHIIFEQDCVGR